MTTLQTHGRLHKLFHWWVAIHLGVILFAAFGLADLPLADKKQEYGDHGLATTLLLVVMILRLLWRVSHPAPPLPEKMPRWERLAARLVHYGLYALVFLQCGIGFLLASTTEVDFIPNLIEINYTVLDLVPDRFNDTLQTLHVTVYWMLIMLVVLHIAAAFKHGLLNRDGVMRRMIPFIQPKKVG